MKLSVALCTYNGEEFLEQQLQSIFSQSRPINEIVICDDCSTDRTVQIIECFKLKFPGIIKLYINEKPLKTIKNFEKAVSLTTGDYIFLCDQDDVWRNNKSEVMVNHILATPHVQLLFSNGELINEDDEPMHSTLWDKWGFDSDAKNQWRNNTKAFNSLLYNRNYVTGATVLMNSNIKRRGLPIELPAGYFHDTWFALHAAAQNGLAFIDESFIQYRVHKSQQVGISREGKNIGNVFNNHHLSKEDFVNSIYKLYPQHEPKVSFWLGMKIYLYNLINK